jgi:hypothetical protein
MKGFWELICLSDKRVSYAKDDFAPCCPYFPMFGLHAGQIYWIELAIIRDR